MVTQPVSSPILVYSPKSYAQMLTHLRQQQRVALDTESDSLYRYYPRVCLIQLSAKVDNQTTDPQDVVDYLVDPLRLNDLSALGNLFATPDVEVVMHAAENDMLLLQRNFGFTFRRVFDTQLAARILGWKQVGLAAILEAQFGIVSDKRMQRTNWGKRPLNPEQITYAQMDTRYLLTLRELLIDELKHRERWDEAQEAFDRLNVLEALWLWREAEARQQNRPPFKIIADAVLLELAKQMPATIPALHEVPGLSENQVGRFGTDLLHTLQEAAHRPQPHPPEYELRPELTLDKGAMTRFDALRRWRSELAQIRDVAPDIILTNSTLLTIAQRNPTSETELQTISELGTWKAHTYGPQILATLLAHTPQR
jgi:ribonuclease D